MTVPGKHHTGRRNAPPVSPSAGMREEILAGLHARPKKLSPKYFYDAEGARLFEEITTLPEYYPTRTELGILHRALPELVDLAGPRVALVEYGSGAGIKVRLLLEGLEAPVAYVPIDISGEQLDRLAAALRSDYPGIVVHPIRADYTRAVSLPALPRAARRIAFFPGSTIGNFEPNAATNFLRGVRTTVGAEGGLILGVDRVKDGATLERAYDDAAGVTARFNKNLLVRLNRELAATFDVDRFAHEARWNRADSRIEMHLRSLEDQVVQVGGTAVSFARDETIWTESSYKYDHQRLERMVTDAGFRLTRLWTDPEELFWVAFLE